MVTEARQRPARRVAAPVAEKYLMQRRQSFTLTHARAMGEHIDTGGTEADYYTRFLEQVEKSRARWERDVEQIDADPNMTFIDKRIAKNRLSRVWPAWTVEQEGRFVSQYGDPRMVDRGRLDTLLNELQTPDWENALREGQPVVVPKSDWERKFYAAITDPQDGSVPLGLNVPTVGQPAPPPPSGLTDAQKGVLARTCPHCGKVAESAGGNKRHQPSCKDNA